MITWTQAGCDYFIAEKADGFVVLEWYGGSLPNEGDTWYGVENTYGFQGIGSGSKRMRVWTEDYLLPESSALSTANEKCD